MASTAVQISRSEYDARTAAGERLEYDNGAVIEMPNNDSVHDWIKAIFNRALNRQLDDPIVAANELAFEVAPGRIRHPDVAVCLFPRPIESGKKLQGAPDLAIEIVSESDTAQDLDNRVRLYLENGARAVWVVWPNARRIDIHQLHAPTRHYEWGDTLVGEEPIPQFRLPVAALFE
jgi:Uma2 family endonuclease